MQRFGSQGEEFYFDTVDYVRDSSGSSECESSEESVSGGTSGGVFGYGIWTNEPGSVKERRKNFLQGMGFGELVDSELDFPQKIDKEMSRNNVGWERMLECSGAVSSSSGLDDDSKEEADFVCCRKDPESRTKVLASELIQKRCGTSISKVLATKLDQKRFDRMSTPGTNEFEASACGEKCDMPTKKKLKSWWKRMMCKRKGRGGIAESNVSGKNHDVNRMKVHNNKKTCVEFTAVYMDQEVEAHKGFVWTMKFSPDGQFLASGGEDGVVRIWRVTSTIALEGGSKFVDRVEDTEHFLGRKNLNPASVVIPKKVFRIEESPVQEFHGHTSDVLDICWSKSNCLLSSSKDNTVRLWQVGSDECRQIFYHNNYVTCIQFNPVNDAYFISGSIDGKVRIWGVTEKRVVDWEDVRDIVTAICYQPNGKQGFIVGSIKGRCRFYDTSGTNPQMNAQIRIHCRKKSSNSRITSFQFSPEDSHKIMITSADSKVRIFDGSSVIQKYKGLPRSGSQLSASYTSNGRHIISVGEDSHVYVWSCNDVSDDPSSKHTKSTRSCEHFFYEGVSVAIPWSGPELDPMELSSNSSACFSQSDDSFSCSRDSDRFAFGGWFSVDNRGSVTWPEEKLLPWTLSGAEQDDRQHEPNQIHNHEAPSESWGLVIVTSGWDGKIRTFHNYGLPVRLEKSSKSCKS